jgi:CHAD domain-containing protein
MTTEHLEVEDKYDLDPSTVLPDFSSLKGVRSVTTTEQQLEAAYFDTADLDLARAGVVLRRRTGGEDAGWHLKLPQEGARLEITAPLGRAVRTPPVALRRVVAGLVHDQPLATVVTIRTDRRVHRLHDKGGEVLAEVADDRVAAEPVDDDVSGLAPITWREAEVELLSDRSALLGGAADLLAEVGARRSDAPSKLARALGDRLPPSAPVLLPEPRKKRPASDVIRLRLMTQVAAARRLDPWVRHGSPGSVHDLRVAVRRLRNALASYRPFLDREESEPLREELGWLAASLGGPRDAEVLHELIGELLDDVDPLLVRGPVRARVDRELHERVASTRAELLVAMTSQRYFELLDRLEALAMASPWTDAAHEQARRVLPKRLDHDWTRLRDRVRAAERDREAGGSAPDLHAVRKAAKRVRYAAEALVPLYGKDAERMVAVHERIQTVLGDHHDAVEGQAALDDLAERAAEAGENGFTYGVLHARLEARRAGLAAEFDRAWQDSVAARDRHPVG